MTSDQTPRVVICLDAERMRRSPTRSDNEDVPMPRVTVEIVDGDVVLHVESEGECRVVVLEPHHAMALGTQLIELAYDAQETK